MTDVGAWVLIDACFSVQVPFDEYTLGWTYYPVNLPVGPDVCFDKMF